MQCIVSNVTRESTPPDLHEDESAISMQLPLINDEEGTEQFQHLPKSSFGPLSNLRNVRPFLVLWAVSVSSFFSLKTKER